MPIEAMERNVTLILFLTSLAVLEYLTRGETPRTRTPKLPAERAKNLSSDPPARTGEGIAALGNALDLYGRGNTPGTVIEPAEVNKTPLDRV